jgi:phosphomannomutase/phosphoglucomutase
VDCGNGMGGLVGPDALRLLGCRVTGMYVDVDGRFPNHHPDPTVAANLQDLIKKVRETKADVGIAYDGDADRIGAVDEKGDILWGDRLLVLYARDVLKDKPGAAIISEVKASQVFYDDVVKHGGRSIMWKTGHSLIKAKMKEEKAVLAGEMSGHMFFADRYFGYDDAVYASCRLIEILAKAGRPLSTLLADLPTTVSTPEIRVDCPDDVKFQVVEEAKKQLAREHKIIDIDGVRVLFPEGWGLIRASNTQPALVLRFEATSEAALQKIREVVESQVKKYVAGGPAAH